MPRSASESLFKPQPHKDKAENTNSAARAIIDAEVKASKAKSARLREQRLARDAAAPPPPPKKAPARKVAATR